MLPKRPIPTASPDLPATAARKSALAVGLVYAEERAALLGEDEEEAEV
jgi:hypothetical protein